MHTLFTQVYLIALIVSLIILALSAIIGRRNLKRMGLPVKTLKAYPKITLLKPLKGLDDNLKENLQTFFELDYPDYEIIFGLQTSADPAAFVALELLGEYNHIRAKIIVEKREIGLNPKINNLHNMMQAARGSYILISDSNTQVQPDFLKRMMSGFVDPEVGLVTAAIRGTGENTIPAAMENLHLNTFVTPFVFIAETLSDIPIVIGKSILMPRQLLERLGGFEIFKNYLAEDYLLGRKVKQLGYQVRCVPVFVNNINRSWPWSQFINRHTRWAKIRRNMHLHYYLLETLSNPIPISAILMLLMLNQTGFYTLIITSIIKIAHDYYISGKMNSRQKWYFYLLVPIKDLAISIFWLVPFFSDSVVWRENRFRIRKQSLLTRAA